LTNGATLFFARDIPDGTLQEKLLLEALHAAVNVVQIQRRGNIAIQYDLSMQDMEEPLPAAHGQRRGTLRASVNKSEQPV
jgi:uncharacterized beta-barrel protein YwiB (DUF1934 family)